jgi:hypothetical protein
MNETALVALVRLAISLHKYRGCLEYESNELQRRIQRELQNVGTPRGLRDDLIRHAGANDLIECRKETRTEFQDRREFWFRALVAIPGFHQPLFYELELTDDDPECPQVSILNVHF